MLIEFDIYDQDFDTRTFFNKQEWDDYKESRCSERLQVIIHDDPYEFPCMALFGNLVDDPNGGYNQEVIFVKNFKVTR